MRYGLVAGNGRFPLLALESARQLGHDVTVIAIGPLDTLTTYRWDRATDLTMRAALHIEEPFESWIVGLGASRSFAEDNTVVGASVNQVLDWFERIAESERGFIELERTVKYDKLGVQNALILVESTRDQKRLIAPQQFLPLLDRVTKNESYMHMARERAAAFAVGRPSMRATCS